MKQVLIMRAIPGSGKTTIAKAFVETIERNGDTVAYCSADNFHVGQDGVYRFDPKLAGNAHIWCMRRFLDAIRDNIDYIIVDNTNTQVWEYTPYVQVALAEGYDVKIIEVQCDYDVALKRQIHGVPAEHHKRMADRFQKTLPHHKQFRQIIKN